VWWGLRASAAGNAPGFPVIVSGGHHADVPMTAETGAALGRLIAGRALACVVDLSELGSNAARRRFMAGFCEALYEANEEPLHLVLDEADLWAPQRPLSDQTGLLGHIEEIVRRGRVRGFIPWLITQRPAVVHKDVLSQADILIAMKLTASQDGDAIGGWIWGQLATLAGVKPSGRHFNAGRKSLRDAAYVAEVNDLVTASPAGLKVAGEVPPAPSTPAERLALWCDRLPSPVPEMLRTLAAEGERYMDVDELATALGKKPNGGHWNSGIAVLRNNGLIETDGRRYRAAALLRE
jgi:hypothetical protein